MATPELKSFDAAGLQPFYAGAELANTALRLNDNRRLERRQARILTARLARSRNASATIEALPARNQSLHCILNGTFALWDFVPAVLQLSGRPIDELWIATIGFSKANVGAATELAAAGQVRRMHVLCSHYFAAADAPIYASMVELCSRPGFRVAAMRTHAKILLLATGRHRITVESSANLRSCHNVEQATLFGDSALYEFHRTWIDELLTQGANTATAEATA